MLAGISHMYFLYCICAASEVSLSGKFVVVGATDTLTVGDEADEIIVGGEDVGKVNVQGEAISVAGMCCDYT